jgi:hypothetical protein
VEFVLGQNEKLELTRPKTKERDRGLVTPHGKVESDVEQKIVELDAKVPTIRIETVAPVGRASVSPDRVRNSTTASDDGHGSSGEHGDGVCSWTKPRCRKKKEVCLLFVRIRLSYL